MDIDERVLRVEHKGYCWTTRNWLESDRIRYEKRRDSSFRPHPLYLPPPVLWRRITHGKSYTHLRTHAQQTCIFTLSFGTFVTVFLKLDFKKFRVLTLHYCHRNIGPVLYGTHTYKWNRIACCENVLFSTAVHRGGHVRGSSVNSTALWRCIT